MKIAINHTPTKEQLAALGVSEWPIWEHEAAEFPWSYDATETCYLLEGDVTVTPEGSEPLRIRKGDLVTFPKNMSCRWNIHTAVKKHYKFS